jgi:ABC-type glycerol-3-phosphate transport system permease component
LPEKPDANQLAKAQTYGFEYKNLLKALGMFFTILTICALLGLAIAMFDEKIRMLFFYDNVYLFIIPAVMILITLTMRLFGLILNSGMEFIIGGLFGLAVHYLFLSYTKKKANINENTP